MISHVFVPDPQAQPLDGRDPVPGGAEVEHEIVDRVARPGAGVAAAAYDIEPVFGRGSRRACWDVPGADEERGQVFQL